MNSIVPSYHLLHFYLDVLDYVSCNQLLYLFVEVLVHEFTVSCVLLRLLQHNLHQLVLYHVRLRYVPELAEPLMVQRDRPVLRQKLCNVPDQLQSLLQLVQVLH